MLQQIRCDDNANRVIDRLKGVVGMILSINLQKFVAVVLCGIAFSAASFDFGFAEESENKNCDTTSCTSNYLKVYGKTHGI